MKRFILTIAIFLMSLFGFSQGMVLVGTSLGFNRSIVCSTYSQERWCHYCEWNGWSHYHYYDYVYPTRVATTIRVYHSVPAHHPAHHHHHYVPPKPAPQHTGTHNVAPRPKSSSTVRQSAPQHKPSSSSSVRSSSTRTSAPRSTTNTRR